MRASLKWNRLHGPNLRGLELIEWIGQVQRYSRAKQSMSKRREQRVCWDYQAVRSAFSAWRLDVWLRKTGELSQHFDASVCSDDLSLLSCVIRQVRASFGR